jgi:putative transposase
MPKDQEADRRRAVQRYRDGESASAICASMGYSRQWTYKWLKRFESGDEDWFRDRSRRPDRSPTRTREKTEELVIAIRKRLESQDLFHGAQAIHWELEDLDINPLPSVRTIGRILERHDLIRRRQGPYQSKGKRYPAPFAKGPGTVHQTDFVGPRYLKGSVRFYSLNSVDLATGRCAVQPVLRRAGQDTVDAVWKTWHRLGMPKHHQVDNETVFYGSPTHPRGMGSLIRLCLHHGIQVWFIPPGEPWRNGVVEKFNNHWDAKFLRRIDMNSEEALFHESLRFEGRHNSRYRYSKLGGKTPQAALESSGVDLRFPPTHEPPRHPLAKPESGKYHLIRFVRSDSRLDVFGEKFPAPLEAVYEYVRLTINVAQQRLMVFLDEIIIDEHDYKSR